ncbi:MAG: flagellar protein FlaG [Deltaproteobacteria bacterium]|nr:flagellar protein FlaG [Candidatus Anaeroferrophillacea bacterium]
MQVASQTPTLSGLEAAPRQLTPRRVAADPAGDGAAVKPAADTAQKSAESLISPEELKRQVEETASSLNEMATLLRYGIRFAFHEKAHTMQVNVIERATDRVIREIPPKDILDLRAKMMEMVGLIIDQKG